MGRKKEGKEWSGMMGGRRERENVDHPEMRPGVGFLDVGILCLIRHTLHYKQWEV